MSKEAICIDSNLIGTKQNLLINDGFRWIDYNPSDVWYYSGSIKNDHAFCFDSLLRLNRHVIDTQPHKKFITMMEQVTKNHSNKHEFLWKNVMPKRAHSAFMKDIVNASIESMDKMSKDYYSDTWVPESMVLRSLKPAKIDVQKFKMLEKIVTSNLHILQSFRPDVSGYSKPVEYNRFGTRTGRLTVASGPNVLTLNKEHRNIITSRFRNGKIVYVDFSGLEARILLYEAGRQIQERDLYAMISNELFNGSISRKIIKEAIISEVYGSGKQRIKDLMKIDDHEVTLFTKKISSYFKVNELKNKLKNEFFANNVIKNRYGRELEIEVPLEHIYVNTYTQSTGVDVSLLGFSQIVNEFESNQNIVPLFMIHDALLLDVATEDDMNLLKKLSSLKIQGYDHEFPISYEFIE